MVQYILELIKYLLYLYKGVYNNGMFPTLATVPTSGVGTEHKLNLFLQLCLLYLDHARQHVRCT